MRISKHGEMLTDALLIADAEHLAVHTDDRSPEQLCNTAGMPGIVGEAWAMADWHFGYGFPIGGVVATDIEAGELGGAIDDLQALLRRFPGDHRLHYELGFTALLARRLNLSIEHFRRALEFKPDDQLSHYNLACAYALAGRAPEAIGSLQAAIQFGFDDADHLQEDKDLQSLRGNKDFEKLVKSLRQKSSP